jgi:thymidylate synthase
MRFLGTDMGALYAEVCRAIMMIGESVEIGGVEMRELMDAEIVLMEPRARFSHPDRKMSMKYFVGELCWYLDRREDLSSIARYSKFWEHVSDDGQTINSAYGLRLFGSKRPPTSGPWPERTWPNQFDYAASCLVRDKNTRKAVLTIYDASDARESKDNPCTMFLHFLIRDNKLHLMVSMRSNDVWLGVPYDVAFFAIVQEIMLVMLRNVYPDLELGTYRHRASSLHAYARDFDAIRYVGTDFRYHEPVFAPWLTKADVRGWFDDLLTYEKAARGVVKYKEESVRTEFQDWCKEKLQ